jgi:hypothetical protein
VGVPHLQTCRSGDVYPGKMLFFESYLEIKENIISREFIFGRIRVGLQTKDRKPTQQS